MNEQTMFDLSTLSPGDVINVGDVQIIKRRPDPVYQPGEVELTTPGTVVLFDNCGHSIELSRITKRARLVSTDQLWDRYNEKVVQSGEDPADEDEMCRPHILKEVVDRLVVEAQEYLQCPECLYVWGQLNGKDPYYAARLLMEPTWKCLGCNTCHDEKSDAEACCGTYV